MKTEVACRVDRSVAEPYGKNGFKLANEKSDDCMRGGR